MGITGLLMLAEKASGYNKKRNFSFVRELAKDKLVN